MNTHPRHLPGEHWLALTVEKHGKATFFDSFGLSPEFEYYPTSILRFLERQRGIKQILHHNRQLQHELSDVCGQHCAYYLCLRGSGLSYADVLSHYKDDPVRNDAMVSEFVKKYQKCLAYPCGGNSNQLACSLQMFKDCYRL